MPQAMEVCYVLLPVCVFIRTNILMNIIFPALLEMFECFFSITCTLVLLTSVLKTVTQRFTDPLQNLCFGHLVALAISFNISLETTTFAWGKVTNCFALLSALTIYMWEYPLTSFFVLLEIVEKGMDYIEQIVQPDPDTIWTRLKKQTEFCVEKTLTWLSIPKNTARRALIKISEVTYNLAIDLDSKEEKCGYSQKECQKWVNSSPEIYYDKNKAGANHNSAKDDSISVQSGNSKDSDTSAYSTPSPAKGTKWGFTVIFNMINFSAEGLDQRRGAENDEELIKEFLAELGSDVDIHRDMSKKELLEKLDEYSKKDHSPNCNFLCFIMSHGSEMGIFCSDGELVSLSDAMNPFGKSQCPSLKNKPKIFVIDACLGDKKQMPMYGREGPLRSKIWDSGISGLSSTSDRVFGPQEEDFLILYTTIPGHVSYRSDFGSPSVTQLIELLKLNREKGTERRVPLDLAMRKLSKNMCSEDFYVRQIPCIVSTLTKLIYISSREETEAPEVIWNET